MEILGQLESVDEWGGAVKQPARQAAILARVGAIKVVCGLVAVAAAIYVLSWPPDATEWLTQWLDRLQEPIAGATPGGQHEDWRNVSVGLLLIFGTWTCVSGAGDSIEARIRRAANRHGPR